MKDINNSLSKHFWNQSFECHRLWPGARGRHLHIRQVAMQLPAARNNSNRVTTFSMLPLCTEDCRMNSAACTHQDNLQHSKTQKMENPQHEEIHTENNRLERKSFTVNSRHITHKDFRRKIYGEIFYSNLKHLQAVRCRRILYSVNRKNVCLMV
jgi:hypothetical protein